MLSLWLAAGPPTEGRLSRSGCAVVALENAFARLRQRCQHRIRCETRARQSRTHTFTELLEALLFGEEDEPVAQAQHANGAPASKPRSSRNCFGTVTCPFSPILVVVRYSRVVSRVAMDQPCRNILPRVYTRAEQFFQKCGNPAGMEWGTAVDIKSSFPSRAGLRQGIALGKSGLAQADIGVNVFHLFQGRVAIGLDRLKAVGANAFFVRHSGELGVCFGSLAAHDDTSETCRDGINAVSLGSLRTAYHFRKPVLQRLKTAVCDRRHLTKRQITPSANSPPAISLSFSWSAEIRNAWRILALAAFAGECCTGKMRCIFSRSG